MDTFWLEFKDGDLERDYQRQALRNGQWENEAVYISTELLASLVRVGVWNRHGRVSAWPILGVGMNVGWLVGCVALREKRRDVWESELRTPLVLCTRGCRTLSMALCEIHTPCSERHFPANSLSALLYTIAHSELFTSLPHSFGLKLNFKHHVMHHTLHVLLMLFAKSRSIRTCTVPSKSATHLLFFENVINVLCQRMYTLFLSPFCLVILHQDKEPIFQLVTMCHLCLGIGVVCVVAWIMEKQSRLQFAKSLRERGDEILRQFNEGLGDSGVLSYMKLSLFTLVLCWECLDWLPTIVKMAGK